MALPRFPSPLIKPDVRISRIRLSDWLHRKVQIPTKAATYSNLIAATIPI